MGGLSAAPKSVPHRCRNRVGRAFGRNATQRSTTHISFLLPCMLLGACLRMETAHLDAGGAGGAGAPSPSSSSSPSLTLAPYAPLPGRLHGQTHRDC